jgi:hypothetical protein
LNDPSEQWPFRFNITFSEDELRTYRKVMAARHAGGKNQGTVYGIMLAGILVFGLVVFGAFKLGWIESAAIRPVLFYGLLRVCGRCRKLLFRRAPLFP